MSSRKNQLRARRQADKKRAMIAWGLILLGVAAIVGFFAWRGLRPSSGVAVAVEAAGHVPDGAYPGPYTSNPPTSGNHYASNLEAGFYHEDQIEALGPYPEGYLIHDLEHGYVIFWYDCQVLDDAGCRQLKTDIQATMEKFDNFKVIAFPWDSLEVPLVLTSWGYLQEFEVFNQQAVDRFVRVNRLRAPEPHAD